MNSLKVLSTKIQNIPVKCKKNFICFKVIWKGFGVNRSIMWRKNWKSSVKNILLLRVKLVKLMKEVKNIYQSIKEAQRFAENQLQFKVKKQSVWRRMNCLRIELIKTSIMRIFPFAILIWFQANKNHCKAKKRFWCVIVILI